MKSLPDSSASVPFFVRNARYFWSVVALGNAMFNDSTGCSMPTYLHTFYQLARLSTRSARSKMTYWEVNDRTSHGPATLLRSSETASPGCRSPHLNIELCKKKQDRIIGRKISRFFPFSYRWRKPPSATLHLNVVRALLSRCWDLS